MTIWLSVLILIIDTIPLNGCFTQTGVVGIERGGIEFNDLLVGVAWRRVRCRRVTRGGVTRDGVGFTSLVVLLLSQSVPVFPVEKKTRQLSLNISAS